MNDYKNRISIFAHYDQDNIVDEYVYYYLKELLTVVTKLVFVTVSDIEQKDIDRLEMLNIDVIKRENIGYDFYSYKVGIESLNLELYDELIICNDSAFGPLYPLKNLFKNMEQKECDFWGVTDSYVKGYHLQSYFMVFNSTVLNTYVFQEFWKQMKVIDDKEKLIEQYEVGLSQLLIENNYNTAVFINHEMSFYESIKYLYFRYLSLEDYKLLRMFNLIFSKYYWSMISRKQYNISLALWDTLILKYNMPFVKKSLFINDIEKEKNIQKYARVISLVTVYPVKIIKKYINRNM